MSKKTVAYEARLTEIMVGIGVFVKPIDHPDSENVSNKKFVYTSNVVKDLGDGVFETQNTIYVPSRELN